MARIASVIASFLICLLSSSSAFAYGSYWYAFVTSNGYTSEGWGSTADAACSMMISAAKSVDSTMTDSYTPGAPRDGNRCVTQAPLPPLGNGYKWPFGNVYQTTCGTGQMVGPDGHTCVTASCPSGQTWSDTKGCYDQNAACASSGNLGNSSSKWVWKGNVATTCSGGCFYAASSSGYDKTTGYSIAWGQLINLGASCTASSSPDKPPGYADDASDKPADAPHAGEKGYCPGTVTIGSTTTTVWAKCDDTSDTSVQSSSESSSTAASGAASGAASTGSDSSRSTTKCDGQNCTTTTTTDKTDSAGNKTSTTTTKTEPQKDFCTANPKATACVSSVWSGDCSGGFSGDGDALMLASAKAVAETNCAFKIDPNSAGTQYGKRNYNGQDSGVPGGVFDSWSFSLPQWITGRSYGPDGGGCLPDQSIPFAGTSLTIPFSQYCSTMQGLGLAGNAISMILAIGIVFRDKVT